ncbi:MAG: MBL fold metallo-hydrolase [Actinobacteria bacterium]|nr:MBL fold metallo-hydrolase [Actinomycetota bacterium]
MKIEILGTESMGVRGMSCFVQTRNRKILIDPGIALGFKRYGLLPHPYQVAVGEKIRKDIINKWAESTDVVISHFHGDHVPLPDANPYQLDINELAGLNAGIKIWTKDLSCLSFIEKKRADALSSILNKDLIEAAGKDYGDIAFSENISHGDGFNDSVNVIMTKISEDKIFVHTSDIQLLDDMAISKILDWEPDIVFADGPSCYLPSKLMENQMLRAWDNAVRLSKKVAFLIIDHHLLRCFEGERWLKSLSLKTDNKTICAADFMNKPRMLLEADRVNLYRNLPVPDNWHKKYADGKINTDNYFKSAKSNPDPNAT